MIFSKTKYKIIYCVLIFFITSSCATIFTGVSNKVILDSFPENAQVKLNNKPIGHTPIEIKVKRTLFRRKKVEISKDGFYNSIYYLKREFNYLSLLSGTFIPLDALSGAIVNYKDKYVNSKLAPKDTSFKIFGIDKDEYIHIWNNKVKLNWNFFKGKITNAFIDNTIQTGAVASTGLNYLYYYTDTIIHLKAFAYFSTKYSWVKEKSKEILNHEQRHFDISEIYARKFRKHIIENGHKNRNIDSLLKTSYTHYAKRLNEAQEKYDLETGHGINKEMQKTWDLTIDKELSQTTTFEKNFYQIKLQ